MASSREVRWSKISEPISRFHLQASSLHQQRTGSSKESLKQDMSWPFQSPEMLTQGRQNLKVLEMAEHWTVPKRPPLTCHCLANGQWPFVGACLLRGLLVSKSSNLSLNKLAGRALTTIRDSCLQRSRTAGSVSELRCFNFHLCNKQGVNLGSLCTVLYIDLLMQCPPPRSDLLKCSLELDGNQYQSKSWAPVDNDKDIPALQGFGQKTSKTVKPGENVCLSDNSRELWQVWMCFVCFQVGQESRHSVCFDYWQSNRVSDIWTGREVFDRRATQETAGRRGFARIADFSPRLSLSPCFRLRIHLNFQ